MNWLTRIMLAVTAIHMAKDAAGKQTEEPEVEILSNRTNLTKFGFHDGPIEFAILHSSDCSRSLAADKPSKYYVYVAAVGVNTATGTFERCESPHIWQSAMKIERYKEYVELNKVVNSEFSDDVKTVEKNNTDWTCGDVESWWKESMGTDLPSWCTFFSVFYTIDSMKDYRDAQMSVDHGKDLLIFKPSIEAGGYRPYGLDTALDLIEDTIIDKSIPRLFLEHNPEFRTTTSPTESKGDTTRVSTTQEDQRTSSAQVTAKDDEPMIDQRTSTTRHGMHRSTTSIESLDSKESGSVQVTSDGRDVAARNLTTDVPATSANVTAPSGQDGSGVNATLRFESKRSKWAFTLQSPVTAQTSRTVTTNNTYNDSVTNSTKHLEKLARSTTPKRDQKSTNCNVPVADVPTSIRLLPLWLVIAAVIGLLVGFGGGVLVGLGRCRCNCCDPGSESDDSVKAPPKSVTIKTATNISDNARSRIQHSSGSIYDGRFLRESKQDATSLSKPLSIHTAKQ